MHVNRWTKLWAISMIVPFIGLADHGGDKKGDGGNSGNRPFVSSVVGSIPGVVVGGVQSGGAPWTIDSGKASLSPSGKLKVDVRGLLLTTGAPPNLVGTTGPVQMVAASLVCGGSGGTVAASTDGVPLSPNGDADIDANLSLPATCMAPVVLVRVFVSTAAPGSELGPFIALTGFNKQANPQGSDDNNDQP
jgi:hypothetical protein